MEVRPIVQRALDILTPILPSRMDDGYRMLIHWTNKILVEDGHSVPQLVHILQLIIRHYKVVIFSNFFDCTGCFTTITFLLTTYAASQYILKIN